MSKWFLPATVLGLSGLGLIFASERARGRVVAFIDRMAEDGNPLGEFSQLCEEQLNNIQKNLERLAEALQDSEA